MKTIIAGALFLLLDYFAAQFIVVNAVQDTLAAPMQTIAEALSHGQH